MTPAILALSLGSVSWGQLIVAIILIAACIAIAVVAIKAMEVPIPGWVVKIFWIVVIAIVAILAIRLVMSL